ncbi:protein YgfX [Methylobacter sp. G7]|uniref:protein YgfX n=1 Tax=Methylobacter sp. G7 TaxID=3230117 RepID=UPI003D80627A
MAKKHEASLLVELKPSKRLKQLLVVMHTLALASSIANALPVAVKLALSTGICIHFWGTVKRLTKKSYNIKHTEKFGWEISDGNDFESIQILNSTVITVFAIFLHFNKNAQKQSLLILNDALTEDDYRRLIVRLKTAGKK